MNCPSRLVPLAAIALPVLLAGSASAGVVLELKDLSPGKPPTVSKIMSATDRVRVEVDGNVLIFRGDKQVAWLVQADNTYVEMTREGVAGMADAMKQMEAQLAAMPPEQRAMVQAMMKGQAPGAGAPAPPAPLKWTANGKTDEIAGKPCKGYDGDRQGVVEEQVCAAQWEAFGLARSDFRAFEDMAEFMRSMKGPMADSVKVRVADAEIPGVPLRTIIKTVRGEQVQEITKIEKADVDLSLFDLPAGAKPHDIGAGMPAGRRGR